MNRTLRAVHGVHPLLGLYAFDADGKKVGTVLGVDPHPTGAFVTLSCLEGQRYVQVDPAWTFKSQAQIFNDRADEAANLFRRARAEGATWAEDDLFSRNGTVGRYRRWAQQAEESEERSLVNSVQMEHEEVATATHRVADATFEIAHSIDRHAVATMTPSMGFNSACSVMGAMIPRSQ
jgi:hypothetical protein